MHMYCHNLIFYFTLINIFSTVFHLLLYVFLVLFNCFLQHCLILMYGWLFNVSVAVLLFHLNFVLSASACLSQLPDSMDVSSSVQHQSLLTHIRNFPLLIAISTFKIIQLFIFIFFNEREVPYFYLKNSPVHLIRGCIMTEPSTGHMWELMW